MRSFGRKKLKIDETNRIDFIKSIHDPLVERAIFFFK